MKKTVWSATFFTIWYAIYFVVDDTPVKGLSRGSGGKEVDDEQIYKVEIVGQLVIVQWPLFISRGGGGVR